MNETDYNARLYEKMKAEQDKYRDCGCNECGCRWNEIYKFHKKEIQEGQ